MNNLKVSLKRTDQPGQVTDPDTDHVLCETRHFNAQGDFTHRSLNINSPHLKDALRRIVGEYPGVTFKSKSVRLQAPYQCLFHYLEELRGELEGWRVRRKVKGEVRGMNVECEGGVGEDGGPGGRKKEEDKQELEKKAQELENERIEHLGFLVEFIEEEFKEVIFEAGNYLPEGLISYGSLWTILKPGTIILQNSHGHHHALSLVRSDYYYEASEQLVLTLAYIDYNGKGFGIANSKVALQAFEGLEKITELQAYPLIYHPRHKAIRRQLITRGRRFETFFGRHYAEYKDVGLGEVVDGHRREYHINGRVIIDADTYSRYNPTRFGPLKPLGSLKSTLTPSNDPPDYSDYTSDLSDYEDDCPAADKPSEKPPLRASTHRGGLADAQCLITHYLLPGFSVSNKTWVEVFLDTLAPIHWNRAALDSLAIPTPKKALMTSLVESHIKSAANKTPFDDIIPGKGRGHLFILHGPPGVGKTLTAEAIAEQTRRPLFTLSAGELGSTPQALATTLQPILDLTTTWKAILLLEEADTFLEPRNPGEVQRNMLFSTFLNLLDGYKGIIFMTTNRVTTIDEAMKSRAHVVLEYPELGSRERHGVWEAMLMREGNCSFAMLENTALRELAMREEGVDGRMIRNVVVGARGLGERRGRRDGAGVEEVAAMLEGMGVHDAQMAGGGARRRGGGGLRVSVVSGKDGMQVVDQEIWTPLWFDNVVKRALEGSGVGAEFSRFQKPI